MNAQASLDTRPSWTWADQISTYRFWGLLIFYVLSVAGASYLLSTLEFTFLDRLGVDTSLMIYLPGAQTMGALFGFYLAWAATRWRTILMLIVLGLLEILGVAMIFLPGVDAPITIRLVGSAVFGMGAGALTLAVPAIIAGGRGGAEAFLISFGIVSIMSSWSNIASAAWAGMLIGFDVPAAILVGVPIVVGLLFLLPVGRKLFSEPPPPRGYAFTPTYRHPVAVGLLCLIPFYWLYWLYRAHGEVASVAPSRSILSPRGAVCGAILIPFLYLVQMTSLIDALNRRAADEGKPPLLPPWVVFLCGFLLSPVAVALVQSAINQTAARTELDAVPAPAVSTELP